MNSRQGILFVISAPSGAGKTSLVNRLLADVSNLHLSTSYTTRHMRPGEKEGEHYHFVETKTFKEMINADKFIEYACVFDQYYGTSREWLEQMLAQGRDVILEIDWQGAQQVRRIFVNCISIFILPPSKQILLQRMRQRAQDAPEVIEYRMALASQEISHYKDFDYLVVNDDFDEAHRDMQAIVSAQRLLRSQQEVVQSDLLKDLLTESAVE